MNDEINKMMRQKHHWEVRIRELGGDVQKGRQFYDIEGKELPGAPGYKYYGAAKELPGVRELFAEGEEEVHSRRNKRSVYCIGVTCSHALMHFFCWDVLFPHYSRPSTGIHFLISINLTPSRQIKRRFVQERDARLLRIQRR